MRLPGVREDRRTGQFVPTINGKDTSPTSFDVNTALAIAYEQLGLPQPTAKDRAICSLQAACIEAMGELEQGHPKEAHDTLQDALLEGI